MDPGNVNILVGITEPLVTDRTLKKKKKTKGKREDNSRNEELHIQHMFTTDAAYRTSRHWFMEYGIMRLLKSKNKGGMCSKPRSKRGFPFGRKS